jgi:hypothetical protein
VLVLVLLTMPAAACGCGGYISHDGTASVSRERALLRWDGQREQLVIALDVLGSSTEAALVLPVPARATVKLGDARVWTDLQQLTAPVVRHEAHPAVRGPLLRGPGAGAPAPTVAPVIVLDRQILGPFDVSNLAATDANALAQWLNENGYSLSADLARTLTPYIAQRWYYVAIRLRPGSGDILKGSLDPLWLTFEASAPVYPMRASANAKAREDVTLYVLADHRAQKQENFGDSAVPFAGWIEPSTLAPGSPLGPFVDRRLFLTEFRDTVEPARVNDDFHIRFADADEAHRDEIVVYDLAPATDDSPEAFSDDSAEVLALTALVVLAAIALWLRPRRSRRQRAIGVIAFLGSAVLLYLASQVQDSTDFPLVWLLFLGSAVWVAWDSGRIHLRDYQTRLASNPIILGFSVALLWIVFFPMYLAARYRIAHGIQARRESQHPAPVGLGLHALVTSIPARVFFFVISVAFTLATLIAAWREYEHIRSVADPIAIGAAAVALGGALLIVWTWRSRAAPRHPNPPFLADDPRMFLASLILLVLVITAVLVVGVDGIGCVLSGFASGPCR